MIAELNALSALTLLALKVWVAFGVIFLVGVLSERSRDRLTNCEHAPADDDWAA